MKKNILLPVIIAVVVTAAVVWGLASLFLPPETADARVEELKEEVQMLREEKEELAGRLIAKETEIEVLQGKLDELETILISHQPKAGWEQYFPTHDSTTLAGESVQDVEALLGVPPVLIRSIAQNEEFNREIWIFMPYEQDPTGLYLYFKGNQLWRSQLDEFTGLYGSGLLQYEDFWMN